MRKIYGTQPGAFLALLAACVTSAGCGNDPAPVAKTEANHEAAAAAPAPTVDVPDTGIAPIALAKWTGDLDGMIERRVIRVLTTYSKTSFFIDQGTQRGLVPDAFKLFEDDLNKRLKNKHLRVQVVIVPLAHDELMPALLEGRGDIVAAGTLINDWRRESVDFTNPTRSGISIIPVTGPGVPPVTSVQDLGGRELYLRPSDIPARGRRALQRRTQGSGQAAGPGAARARSARGRGHAGDGQRRPRARDAGRGPHRRVLAAGVSRPRAQSRGGPAHRRPGRHDGAQGEPEAARRAERVPRPLSGRVAHAQRAAAEVPEERQVREVGDSRRRTSSASAQSSTCCASTATSTTSTTC